MPRRAINFIGFRILEIECRIPASLEFGTITRLPGSVETRTGFLWFESQLRYECDDNYEMENQDSGMLTVTCLENGDWSDALPVCIREYITCFDMFFTFRLDFTLILAYINTLILATQDQDHRSLAS